MLVQLPNHPIINDICSSLRSSASRVLVALVSELLEGFSPFLSSLSGLKRAPVVLSLLDFCGFLTCFQRYLR